MPMGKIVRVAPRSNKRGLNFKQVKQVQKIVNSNRKLKNNQVIDNQSLVSGTPYLAEFTALVEGDNYNERISDKILVQSLKGHLCFAQNATPTGQVWRMIIARSKIGSLAAGDFPTTTGDVDLDKMQVYADRIWRCSDADFDPMIYDFYKSFKNKKVPHLVTTYDDDVSATAAVHNPIYIYMISNTATNGVTVALDFHLKYFNAN